MAGLDLFAWQEEVKAYVQSVFPLLTVESGALPSAESLPLERGVLEPYIILRFSDMMPSASDYSFGGPVFDGYYTYVDALCLGPTDDDARELSSLVSRELLGKQLPNGSAIAKAFGGGRFAILSEANRQPVAFVAVCSFRSNVNISDVGAGSLL